jgi:hypothetical protein
MKRLLCIIAGLAMALTAATALAADITGTWTATAQSPNGDFQLTFTFKQDGANLTGTVQGPQGDALPISNGKVDGDKFTFDVSLNGFTIHHACTVTGDEIKMSAKSDSADFPGMDLTLKRAKDAGAAAPPTATPPAQ